MGGDWEKTCKANKKYRFYSAMRIITLYVVISGGMKCENLKRMHQYYVPRIKKKSLDYIVHIFRINNAMNVWYLINVFCTKCTDLFIPYDITFS